MRIWACFSPGSDSGIRDLALLVVVRGRHFVADFDSVLRQIGDREEVVADDWTISKYSSLSLSPCSGGGAQRFHKCGSDPVVPGCEDREHRLEHNLTEEIFVDHYFYSSVPLSHHHCFYWLRSLSD